MFVDPNLTREFNPSWLRDPRDLRLRWIRRGILYTGLEPHVPSAIATAANWGTDQRTALAAMGPHLFWGRDDGPWIPWDLEATDENRECKVRDRDWPWCWGDTIWACLLWEDQPTYLKWELDGGCEVYVGKPSSKGLEEASLHTRGAAVFEVGASSLSPPLPKTFWLFRAPDQGFSNTGSD